VYHTLSGNPEKMAKAFAEGAKSVQGTDVVVKKALDATLKTLSVATQLLLGQPIISVTSQGHSRIFSTGLTILPRVR
jgi:flavorubredoxin